MKKYKYIKSKMLMLMLKEIVQVDKCVDDNETLRLSNTTQLKNKKEKNDNKRSNKYMHNVQNYVFPSRQVTGYECLNGFCYIGPVQALKAN